VNALRPVKEKNNAQPNEYPGHLKRTRRLKHRRDS
jgi:hypothetical protein